jgi:hypothetical protein
MRAVTGVAIIELKGATGIPTWGAGREAFTLAAAAAVTTLAVPSPTLTPFSVMTTIPSPSCDPFTATTRIPSCEHIPTWISFSGDLAFSHQDGIYGFKFPKRFSELSQAKTSLYSLYLLY